MINSFVPALSKHVIAGALRYKPRPVDKHSKLWNSIFENENWLSVMSERGLNPVLIGHDLHQIYHAENIKTKTKSTYLVLVLGYDGDGGKYEKPYVADKSGVLIDSLIPHTRLRSREMFFPKTQITLNICDAVYDHHYTTITQPQRLLSRELGRIYSAVLYCNDDSFEVRTI